MEKKTGTKINVRVKSKGRPAVTSQELNAVIAKVCEQNQIEYIENQKQDKIQDIYQQSKKR